MNNRLRTMPTEQRAARTGQSSSTALPRALEMTDTMWRAILLNDSTYDGSFYYAVKTTGIFCRPSCKSRPPSKEHVSIFRNAEHAMSNRFRPCKRCKPDGLKLPEEEWVDQVAEWINAHYSEAITLQSLADMIHGSPYHLQRTFKRIKGVTPAQYTQQVRMAKAKQLLTETDQTVMDVAIAVGIPNAAHFATLFQQKTGFKPSDYRQMHIETVAIHNHEGG